MWGQLLVGITRRFFDDFCGTKLWALAFDDVFSFIAMGELYDVCKTFIQVPPRRNFLLLFVQLVVDLTFDT
jgi:hypothetical protein